VCLYVKLNFNCQSVAIGLSVELWLLITPIVSAIGLSVELWLLITPILSAIGLSVELEV
jgi:hypothetical protein